MLKTCPYVLIATIFLVRIMDRSAQFDRDGSLKPPTMENVARQKAQRGRVDPEGMRVAAEANGQGGKEEGRMTLVQRVRQR